MLSYMTNVAAWHFMDQSITCEASCTADMDAAEVFSGKGAISAALKD